ncbi:MAG: DUF1015 domain-containing protein [Clostridia bacterium]|nr:DUF1015 domain-containing protein [Clostridia bacterium]
MAVFLPFRAVRPGPAYAFDVAALPYDVMNSEEARALAADKPLSFLHVDKAEIDLPRDVDPYDRRVYETARDNLQKLRRDGILTQDDTPCFYIYRQIMNGRAQTGLVGCASIDDYLNDVIKKHEFTRADKEEDRVNHVDFCDANTGPIFLAYRGSDTVQRLVAAWQNSHDPVYDFVSADGIGNTVWVIDDAAVCAELQQAFADAGCLYIADGHHRCASAVRVGKKRRAQFPDYDGSEAFNYFLAVAFPKDELAIMDYNRVIRDLGDMTPETLLQKLGGAFTVEPAPFAPYRPEARHTFGLLLDGKWYKLTAKAGTFDEADPVASLDVSILQSNCIAPLFGIEDPRTDKRIDFVGGIRGLGELERRCQSDMRLAFSMYPTSLEELMAIADAGRVMPPKSTWFEPKLLSGLFIHPLS